jgi:hypothetical protein
VSVLDPPAGNEPEPVPPIPNPVLEEATTAVAPPDPVKTSKDVCSACMRGVFETEAGSGQYLHWDSRIDDPQNPAFHFADLFIEPDVPWGFLDVRGKSEFKVDQGPSKVHSGWSGNGVS